MRDDSVVRGQWSSNFVIRAPNGAACYSLVAWCRGFVNATNAVQAPAGNIDQAVLFEALATKMAERNFTNAFRRNAWHKNLFDFSEGGTMNVLPAR